MTDVDAVLARVVADLNPSTTDRRALGRMVVEVDGHPLVLDVATRGRLLLRITETTFTIPGPPWNPDARGPLRLEVGHAGMVKRRGPRITVQAGGDEARRLAAALADSATFAAAMLPLDFTTFTIEAVHDQAVARIVLMGASMVRFRIPPSASYTRLHDDQRKALLATAGALHGWWGQGW